LEKAGPETFYVSGHADSQEGAGSSTLLTAAFLFALRDVLFSAFVILLALRGLACRLLAGCPEWRQEEMSTFLPQVQRLYWLAREDIGKQHSEGANAWR
jgi:hypothetical protein